MTATTSTQASSSSRTASTASAVITGIGVVAPNGFGVQDYWKSVLAGRGAIGPITSFDTASYPVVLGGEILDFDPKAHIPSRLLPQTDRVTRLSLVAAVEALADAGMAEPELPEFSAGVVTASSAGGFEFGQRELQALWGSGSKYVSAYQSFAWFYAVNSGQISIKHDLRGPSGVLVSDDAGGLDAIAQARRQVRKGSGLLITGSVDGSLCPWGWVAQMASDRLSASDKPEAAYLPFDQRVNGQVLGEGGALLVMENAEVAAARGARAYGEIAGYAATFDPRPGSGGEPGLLRAAQMALHDAGLEPSQIGAVFADASGVADRDQDEVRALVSLFGARGVPVTAPKTMTGRLASGGGPLDVATALLSMRHECIPPTVNISSPRWPDELDLVRDTPRPAPGLAAVLVLARGYGGFNSAIVVRRCDDQEG
ncbi:MAG TPA: ketosynthase chain-length factor [Jatrophihabitans sp.]|jgi:act minimal PKS chain-length factor (CLF/KS beta)|uniref:ketosynthase chain-length factor n=1 Tax=Jatrophihabitans sp. TaxID=1932789 RepID=UPI002F0F57DF